MFESKVNKGKAWGYAPLDGAGKVPLSKLPPIQPTIDTGSFATINSNTFDGLQTINDSLVVNGSITVSGSSIDSGIGESGDGNGYNTLKLYPDINNINGQQFLIIDPTEPNHIHIRPGGTIDESNAMVIIGGEKRRLYSSDSDNKVGMDLASVGFVTSSTFTAGVDCTSIQWTNNNRITFVNPSPQIYTAIWALNSYSSVTGHYSGFNPQFTYQGSSTPGWPANASIYVQENPNSSPTNLDSIDFVINQQTLNQIRINDNSINIDAYSGIQIGTNDGFVLYNNSTTAPINISTNYDNDPQSFLFNPNGTLTFPNGTIQSTAFTGTANIDSGSFATTGSNTFIGNQNISGSVNISSSLTVSSTFVSNGTLDALNTDLIIQGGYLILSASDVPTNLTGSIGDTPGTFVLDDNHLYYCTASYYGPGPYVTSLYESTNSSPNIRVPKGNYPQPKPGWTVSIYNGFVIATVTGCDDNGSTWYVYTNGGNNSLNQGNDVTFTTNGGEEQIWRTAKLNPSPYKNATIESVNYAPFGSSSWSVNPPTEVTILDIDKSIHLLDITDANPESHWYLPDGYDGQVVRFALKGNAAQSPNSVFVWMDNLRTYNGVIESGTAWSPFYDNNGNGYDNPRSLATAVFVDGAWNIDSDWWGM